MKSQVAIEYMIITSIGLMFILLSSDYLLKTFQSYSDENSISIAKNTVQKIGQSSDLVFSQGPPAKVKIEISIPKGIQEISFSNKTLLFKVKTSSGVNDVFMKLSPR